MLVASLTSAAEPDVVNETTQAPAPRNDYLFPGGGKVAVTASSGFPFMAGGELAVGIGNRIAIGGDVDGGPFPGSVVFSVAPRFDVVHFGPMRVVIETPVLYYPAIGGGDTWFIWRPVMRVEGVAGRVRVYGSAGAIVAKMVGTPAAGPIAPYGGGGLPSGVQQGAAWNQWGAGAALSLSARTSVFLNAFVITRGFEAAGPDWFHLPGGGSVGVTTTL
jgi:hypothetical protein